MASWVEVSRLWAASPTELVKNTVDQVLVILKDPRLQGDAKKRERRAQLRRTILPRFDFPEMAKRSLGNHWQRHASRQEEFIPAFTDFVEASYVGQIESYKNERIVYARERMDSNFAEVETRVLQSKGGDISIHYRLHPVGGEWKVYDVLVDNISFVNNYRSQFNRVITTASFEELLKRLKGNRLEKGS